MRTFLLLLGCMLMPALGWSGDLSVSVEPGEASIEIAVTLSQSIDATHEISEDEILLRFSEPVAEVEGFFELPETAPLWVEGVSEQHN